MTLSDFFAQNPRVALGFSGGVDSAYVLCAAKQHGADIRPYFVKSPFQPEFELQDAKRLSKQLRIPLTVVELDQLQDKRIAENTPERCYFCKTAIFSALKERALADGYTVLIDGTNASDDAGDRPGMRATKELSVRSPLRECGLTKAQVRTASKEAGLFTWDKPAYACLATRIPTGTAITREALIKIERAEDALMEMGFRDLRVRLMGHAARLELTAGDMAKALELRGEILRALKNDFDKVLLDLSGR